MAVVNRAKSGTRMAVVNRAKSGFLEVVILDGVISLVALSVSISISRAISGYLVLFVLSGLLLLPRRYVNIISILMSAIDLLKNPSINPSIPPRSYGRQNVAKTKHKYENSYNPSPTRVSTFVIIDQSVNNRLVENI